MKPVTELMKEARRRHGYMWPRLREAFQCFETGEDGGYEPNWALLEVLDLVATSNRLGLVRWVAGLSVAQTSMLRLAFKAAREAAVEANDEESTETITELASGLDAALSGGEGGAKEERKSTILPAGKPPPFLRVGMVLTDPRNESRGLLWNRDPRRMRWRSWIAREDRYEWDDEAVLLTWPLAEPFTVEGES